MRLYTWDVHVQPNDQRLTIAASSIESAIALAVQNRAQGRVTSACRTGMIDLIEQQEQKGHPYR